VVAKLQIRPGADDELPALVEALGERPFFADRLARQHQGGACCSSPGWGTVP